MNIVDFVVTLLVSIILMIMIRILKFRITFYSLTKFFVIIFAKSSEPTLAKTAGSNNTTGNSTYNGVIYIMICGRYDEYSGLCGDIVGKYNNNDNNKNKRAIRRIFMEMTQ